MINVKGLYKYDELKKAYAELEKKVSAEQEVYDKNTAHWVSQLQDMKEQLDKYNKENRTLKRANQKLKEHNKELERQSKMRWVYSNNHGWVPSDATLGEIASKVPFPLAMKSDTEKNLIIPRVEK